MSNSISRAAFGLLLLAGCSGPAPIDPLTKACEGVKCGNGRCVLDGTRPACLCDTGFKVDNLACVPVTAPPVDKCKPNPCLQSNRTVCTVVDNAAVCVCDPGTYEKNGGCVPLTKCSPNPCTGANQTTCTIVANAAVCSCNAGHVPQGTGCSVDTVFNCDNKHTAEPSDALEPDECPSLAAGIFADDTLQTGRTINPAGDADWYQLTAEPNHVYRASASSAATLPLYVDVYSADGVSTIGFDHLGSSEPKAHFKALVAGTVYIRVRAFRANDTGSYAIKVTDLGIDDYADSPELATPLAIGGRLEGDIQFPGDLDVVMVPLVEGRKYAFGSAVDAGYGPPPPPPPSLTVELVAEDRTTVIRKVQGGFNSRASTAGDHYLRVSGGVTSMLGHFGFDLIDLGPDDHGDAPSEATPITPSTLLTPAQFELPSDVDFFSFDAQLGHIYSFLCNSNNGYYGCGLALTDKNGLLLTTGSSSYSSTLLVEATQAGKMFVRLTQGYSYNPIPINYTYKFEDLGLDDYGDDQASATAIGIGTATAGRLETPTDVDVFSVATTAGRIYRLTCSVGGSACSPSVTNAAGTPVASQGYSSQVSWESTGGTYYVRIGSTYSQPGSYSFVVEDMGVDDYGDTIATATAVTATSMIQAGTIEQPGDLDVFSFSATAPNVYRFSCASTNGSSCSLTLKNSFGAVLQGGGYSQSAASVSVEATTTTTYYVEVGSQYGSAAGSYTFQLQNLGPDDYGDDRLTATPLAAGSPGKAGSLETPTDVDTFSFTAVANRIYRVTCTASAASNCTTQVKNPSNTIVATGSSSGVGGVVSSFEAATAGTFVVEVLSNYNWQPGTYALVLEDIGLDDHGDTAATATALTVPTAQTLANLEVLGDIDVFSFDAVANHIYSFDIGASGYGVELRLKNSGGVIVANGNSSSDVSYKAPTAGKLYVEVALSYGQATPYTYALVDQGFDDHGDTQATATPLTLGTPSSGKIEFGTDADYFSIALTAGQQVNLTNGNSQVAFTVFNPSGATLGYESPYPSPFTATSAGTYFIRVRAYYQSGGFPYPYQVLLQ